MSVAARVVQRIVRHFDSDYYPKGVEATRNSEERFEFSRFLPYLVLHLGCLGVVFVGWSWVAVAVAIVLYVVRMFFITGFYHRYFCHKSYSTSRVGQFIFALLGLTAAQRGPIWWAAVHRHHHRHSDQEPDLHSPGLKGLWWAHIGWLTSASNYPTDYEAAKDLSKYPELVFLNRFDIIGPVLLCLALLLLGFLLDIFFPGLGTSAWQMVVWGFFVSTVCVFHGTCSINSLSHIIGKRRYDTEDDSRNSWLLAIITLGEGWHNNHHHYHGSARQGFYWWEFDPTYYMLKLMEKTGVIWRIREVPVHILEEGGRKQLAERA